MSLWPWHRKKPLPLPPVDVVISRGPSTDQGTFGVLIGPNGFSCKTCELPDHDNQPNISRIPAGRYECTPYRSARFGNVYLVKNVKGRSWILNHSGNLAGDKAKGYRTHSLGCILLGKYFGKLNGQRAAMCSRPVVRAFRNLMGDKPFVLEIKEVT